MQRPSRSTNQLRETAQSRLPSHALKTACGALLALSALLPCVGAEGANWVNAWQGSPTAGATFDTKSCPSDVGLDAQTVRNIVYPSVDGSSVSVRIANIGGKGPLRVGGASIGASSDGGAALQGSAQRLTFAGASAVVVPEGGEVQSDPIARPVKAMQPLAVSIWLPGPTGAASQHFLATQASWLADGNQLSAADMAPFTRKTSCWMFASGVDVDAPRKVAGTVVLFGDSITDGYQSSDSKNRRYPDTLAHRLAARTGPTLAVSNAGIAGNELLTDREQAMFGVAAAARFGRDTLLLPNVRAIVLQEGINDIGDKGAKAEDVIVALQQLVAQAHARGVPVFGGTLLPFAGSNATYHASYGVPAAEAERLKVNEWIRTSGVFDGVIDFDAALRDPADPSRLRADYDSGDHLHPGDRGYQAMADAVDLNALISAATRAENGRHAKVASAAKRTEQ